MTLDNPTRVWAFSSSFWIRVTTGRGMREGCIVLYNSQSKSMPAHLLPSPYFETADEIMISYKRRM